MFKNLVVYRLAEGWTLPAVESVQERLQQQRFVACGATQPRSSGWVEPRGEAHAPLLEVIDGQWLMALMIERKVVPGAVVKREVEALAERIERETGRQPGKKQRRELKDQAQLALLPQAFTQQAVVRVWLAPTEGLLMLDAGSSAKADEVLTQLGEALPGLAAMAVNTALSPAAAMADWLAAGEGPPNFTIDRDCELKAAEGEKPTVRYARHPLDIEEIRGHLLAGKRPTRLALTWSGRVSFVLTESLQVKKVDFLDGVFEGRQAGPDDGFDADAAIATGELAPLIGDLLDALGGEADALGVPRDAGATAATGPGSAATAAATPAAAPRGATLPAPAASGAPAEALDTTPPWD